MVYIQRLIENYPHVFSCIKKRTTPETFYGLPLTCLVVLFCVLLFTFLGITEDVITSGPIVQFDIIVAHLFSYNRDPYIIQFFLLVTMLGKATITIPGALLFSSYLYVRKKSRYILPLIITMVGSSLTVTVVKLLVHRPRPGADIAYYLENSFSFPSGHASISVALYGFVAYYFIGQVSSVSKKVSIALLALLVIILIGFSRIYLGVHYVSDVLVGYIVGTLWLILGITIAEHIRVRSKR